MEPLLYVLLALAARAHGLQDAGRGVLPGAIIVDVRHGLLLPQGRSRQELEPVIRDSLRILDLYLHENGATKRSFRVKRSAGPPKPTGLGEHKRSAVNLPSTRAKRSPHYALNAFAINPKPANRSGGFYTLFARVSEAALQDLMEQQLPASKPHLLKHHESPNRYSSELFEYVTNNTGRRSRLLPPLKAVLPERNGADTKQKKLEATPEGVKCIYRKNSVLCYQTP